MRESWHSTTENDGTHRLATKHCNPLSQLSGCVFQHHNYDASRVFKWGALSETIARGEIQRSLKRKFYSGLEPSQAQAPITTGEP